MEPQAIVNALKGKEDALVTRWLGDRDRSSSISRELLLSVIRTLSGDEPDAVHGPAVALGVVRAQHGRSPSSLVEEIVGLRPVIWGELAGLPELQGDLGALLLLQEQVTVAVDLALRRSTAAYVEESTRVLAHRATRDALTDLLNRAAFDEALATTLHAGERGEPPALVLLDLDGFKQVNDTLGHLEGDEVLVRIGRAIRDAVRAGDVPARLGGDEFAVVLAETSLHDAERVARRIVKSVSRDRHLRGLSVPVGVSAGVARARPGDDPEDLIGVADGALYDAKSAGGSQVVIFDAARQEASL